MDFHHDTSLQSILENDCISLTCKAYISFCLGKGIGLWLVVRPYICSFCIAHSIFTWMLHFCLNLIQPSTFSFFTCECRHGLDASSVHLVHCLFGGQQIITHDAIRDKWAFCMEKAMLCPYIKNFIMSWSLHDLRGPCLCCQCGGY